jgi:hypothetical protein
MQTKEINKISSQKPNFFIVSALRGGQDFLKKRAARKTLRVMASPAIIVLCRGFAGDCMRFGKSGSTTAPSVRR